MISGGGGNNSHRMTNTKSNNSNNDQQEMNDIQVRVINDSAMPSHRSRVNNDNVSASAAMAAANSSNIEVAMASPEEENLTPEQNSHPMVTTTAALVNEMDGSNGGEDVPQVKISNL